LPTDFRIREKVQIDLEFEQKKLKFAKCSDLTSPVRLSTRKSAEICKSNLSEGKKCKDSLKTTEHCLFSGRCRRQNTATETVRTPPTQLYRSPSFLATEYSVEEKYVHEKHTILLYTEAYVGL